MVELSESDSGAERSVAVGDDLVIRLTENRTTGYRWHMSAPGDAFAVVDDTYQPAESGLPGAPGVRTVRLRATYPGSYELTAASRRSWEPGAGSGPGLRFVIHVSDLGGSQDKRERGNGLVRGVLAE
jgi:inhibitor of cysteine peptidase